MQAPLEVFAVPGLVRPIAVAEYHRMFDAGILTEDERVELLEGVIVSMPPHGPSHAHAIERLTRALARKVSDDLRVRPQLPLTLGTSEPEPDIAVVTDDEARAAPRHPRAALLVVEVAADSLSTDRTTKAAIYARARIPEYWIINVADRSVEVYSDVDASSGRYGSLRTLRAADHLASSLLPGFEMLVGELFV